MATVKWVVDPFHSEVQFKVRHLMITNVTGHFNQFEADVQTEGERFMTARVSFVAKADSVNTGNEQRDLHIKSADFFDVARYPELRFVATGFEDVDKDGSYEMFGDLTLCGVTKRITLDVESGGIIKDPWGNTKAGFAISGKINRKDFGLSWQAFTESGAMVASEEVRIHCNIQLIKQV